MEAAETKEIIKQAEEHRPPTHYVKMQDIVVERARGRKDFGNIHELAESIKELGLLMFPVVVPQQQADGSVKYLLKAGERRYRACAGLGWTEIPVHFRTEFNSYHAKMAELHENLIRKQLTWEEEGVLYKQIEAEKIKVHGEGGRGLSQDPNAWTIAKTAALVNEDRQSVTQKIKLAKAMEADPTLKGKLAHLPLSVAMRKHREMQQTASTTQRISTGELSVSQDILLGDAVELIKSVDSDSQDLVATDPPFGLSEIDDSLGESRGTSMTYTAQLSKSDNLSFDDAVSLMNQLMPELYRVMKPSAHIYLFCSTDLYSELVTIANGVGFEGVQMLLWNKGRTTTPFKGLQYPRSFEPILFAHKPPRSKHLSNPKCKDILDFTALHTSKKIHRFQKPPELLQAIVENSSKLGDKVLDPFCGSGGLVRVCRELKRSALAFEIDKDNWARAQTFVQVGFVSGK